MVADNQTTSPSQRLGGGQNVGTQRTPVGTTAIGAASPSAASRLDEGKNVGTQRVVGGGGSSRTALATGVAQRLGGGRNIGTQKGAAATGEQAEESAGLPKLGGVAWWLILGALATIDLVGLALSLGLTSLGVGISATVVGIVIGIPLAMLGWAGSLFLTVNALALTIGYLVANKVPLLGARKLAIWGTSVIIEAIPILSALPTAALSFVIITVTERTETFTTSAFQNLLSSLLMDYIYNQFRLFTVYI